MEPKLNYEELLQKNLELEKEILRYKEAESRLIESEEKYRALVDEIRDGFFTTDLTGAITFCNKALLEMHGYENFEELRGRHFSELISPEARSEIIEVYRKAVKNNDFPDHLEIPVIKQNGTVFFIDLKAGPVFEGGKIVGTRGVNRDITGIKRAEEALRESLRQYSLIATHIGDVVWQLDKDLQFVYVSPSVTQIMGYSITEVLGMKVTEILDQKGIAQMKAYIQKRLQSGQEPIRPNEYRMRHKNGHWLDMEVVSSPVFDHGSLLGFAGVSRDVTERRRMEQELRASEKRYRDLVENMSEVVYVLDRSGKISFISPAVYKLAQYSPSEVIGRPVGDFIYKQDLPRLKDNLKDAMENKKITGDEYRVVNRSGEIRWIETSTRPLYEGNELTGIQGTLMDITERKQAEEALKRLNVTLEQKVVERTGLAESRAEQLRILSSELALSEQRERRRLAEILHDHLQQLLVAAKINCEILAKNIMPGTKQSIENALNLITQSLQISRSLTAELSPLVLKQGRLSTALEWLAHWMQENHGLTVELQTDPGMDPEREDILIFLFQSTRELLFNVVKHAGVTSARLEMVRDKENRLRVTVSDQGTGLDPDTTWEKDQTGFGLLNIRERLTYLGGSLEIESSPGRGVAFSLVVPFEK